MKKLLALFALVMVLSGCLPEAPDENDPQGRTPSQLEAERLACTTDGGMFRNAGLGGLTCIRTTPDAGKSCTRETDCVSQCLADTDTGTGTCAPVTPLFGCHPIFLDDGSWAEICID